MHGGSFNESGHGDQKLHSVESLTMHEIYGTLHLSKLSYLKFSMPEARYGAVEVPGGRYCKVLFKE